MVLRWAGVRYDHPWRQLGAFVLVGVARFVEPLSGLRFGIWVIKVRLSYEFNLVVNTETSTQNGWLSLLHLAAFLHDAGAFVIEDLGGAFGGGLEASGVFGGDVDSSGGGDGVLVGGEENEFPLVFFAMFGDEVGDLMLVVELAGVLIAISEDGDDDAFGALGDGGRLDAVLDFLAGSANGIIESGTASGDESFPR